MLSELLPYSRMGASLPQLIMTAEQTTTIE